MKPLILRVMLVAAGLGVFAVGAPPALAGTTIHIASATTPLPGIPCSVSARLAVDDGAGAMTYSGGVSCAGGGGEKTLDLVPEVYRIVNGHRLWFPISLDGRYQGPVAINPLRLGATRRAVAGHIYRLLVYARVARAGARASALTVCAGCRGAPPSTSPATLSIRPSSTFAAEPGTTRQVPRTRCLVSQDGLVFTLVSRTYVVNYGGYAGCSEAQPLVQLRLRLCMQVAGAVNGRTAWYTVSGSCLAASTTRNALSRTTARTAFLGHGYRVAATATVRYRTSAGRIAARSLTTYSAAAGP